MEKCQIFKFHTAAFTLIELLVTIAILAVLGTAVVVIINPAELIRQGRDSTRLSDLAALHNALGMLLADNHQAYFGKAQTVYVSIPDTTLSGTATSTCASLGLPSLPSGYTYECHSSDTFRKVDGSGWLPVNLLQFSAGSPLSSLPVDPVNTTSTGEFYTYVPGGSWELTASMESTKNKIGGSNDKTSTDKGSHSGLYEIGSNLSLLPIDYGDTSLVGYWSFDEDIGTTAYDRSGDGYNLLIYGSGYEWKQTSSCIKSKCISLSENSYMYASNATRLSFGTSDFTLVAWVNHTRRSDLLGSDFFGNYAHSGQYGDMSVGNSDNSTSIFLSHQPYPSGTRISCGFNYASYFGVWTHLVFSKENNTLKIYINGQEVSSCTASGWNILLNENSKYNINTGWRTGNIIIDEHRVYNRALSAAEIQALYTEGN